MFCEFIDREVQKMIVMDLRIDNFFAFKNFHMNMSYPKKIVDSNIEEEFLHERTNFRYKKINILMGANATGKTSIGKMLMKIFNFMSKKQFERITEVICDKSQKASFTMDFILGDYTMYRIDTEVEPLSGEKYENADIRVSIRTTEIGKKDNYENCAKRIENQPLEYCDNYMTELEKIGSMSWIFEYPADGSVHYSVPVSDIDRYTAILEHTLQALDSSVKAVEKLNEVENTYVIRMQNRSVVMQDGKVIDADILSSGTKSGIAIAGMLASILCNEYRFFYCDEKFSYIHSDIEKAVLSVMIQSLGPNEQLFFTTHNTDILDMILPKHSFTFLKKDQGDKEQPIKCISASQYLKRSTDSLRNAVDNDLFSVAPNLELIYEIADL